MLTRPFFQAVLSIFLLSSGCAIASADCRDQMPIRKMICRAANSSADLFLAALNGDPATY